MAKKNKTKIPKNETKKLPPKKSQKKTTQKSISKAGNKSKGNGKKRTTRKTARVHRQSPIISKKKNKSVSVSKRKVITVRKPKSAKQSFEAKKGTLPRFNFKPDDVRKIRGENIITFKLPERDFSKKAERVKAYTGKEVKKMIEKNRPTKGAGFKPPQAIVTTFKIWNSEKKEYYYISKISKPDFVVNEKSAKQFISDSIKEYYNEADEFLQEHYDEPVKPYNISQVSAKFIY